MNTKVNRLKKVPVLLTYLALFGLLLLAPAAVPTRAAVEDFDAAAVYKTKCLMCHGVKAEKKFDTAKTDEHHIEVILKGKDGSPKMPAYEKTVNADQAKLLVGYMKSLRQ